MNSASVYSGPTRTIEEWEYEFGVAIRGLRLARKTTQMELAKAANVSIGTLRNLEAGTGSSLATLIAVSRALGRTDWLEAITPPTPKVSPMEMLRQREMTAAPKRRYRRKVVKV